MSKIKEVILSILFLGILVFPNISSASTIAELTAMLNSLLAQITSLQQQIAQQTGETPSEEWCHDFDTNLKYGNSGEEVEALQQVLKKEGFGISKDKDGYFGENTSSAVISFQQKYKSEILAPWGLTYGSGYVGATTRKKLNQLSGCEKTNSLTQSSATINASCGSAHGQSFAYKPVVNLCATGTASTVSTEEQTGGIIRYTWICTGLNWGKNVSCYAYDNNLTNTFTVTSPQANEQLIRGQTYNITWINNDPQAESYSIYLIGGNLDPTTVRYIGTVDGFENKFEWTIPFDVMVASNYQLQLSATNLKTSEDKSELFDILSETTTACSDSDGGKDFFTKGLTFGTILAQGPTTKIWEDYCSTEAIVKEYFCQSSNTDILAVGVSNYSCANGCRGGACLSTEIFSHSILSPNGGETWKAGFAYEIKWESTNFSGKNVFINLLDEEGNSVYDFGSIPNNGSYQWTIPDSLVFLSTVGTFKIEIGLSTKGSPIQDLSDDFFYILGSITDGACGSSNLISVDFAPTTNLCNSGTPSAVTFSNLGGDHYQWWCRGIGTNSKDSFCLSYTK